MLENKTHLSLLYLNTHGPGWSACRPRNYYFPEGFVHDTSCFTTTWEKHDEPHSIADRKVPSKKRSPLIRVLPFCEYSTASGPWHEGMGKRKSNKFKANERRRRDFKQSARLSTIYEDGSQERDLLTGPEPDGDRTIRKKTPEMRLLGMSFRERLADIFNRKKPSRKDADEAASARLLAGPFKELKTGFGAVRWWSLPRRLKDGAKKKHLDAAGLITRWNEFLEGKLWPWLETVGKKLACRYHKLSGKAGAKHWGAWSILGEKMVRWGVILKRLDTSSSEKSNNKSKRPKRKKKKSDRELCKQQCQKAERAARMAAFQAGEARQALYEVLRFIEMW